MIAVQRMLNCIEVISIFLKVYLSSMSKMDLGLKQRFKTSLVLQVLSFLSSILQPF